MPFNFSTAKYSCIFFQCSVIFFQRKKTTMEERGGEEGGGGGVGAGTECGGGGVAPDPGASGQKKWFKLNLYNSTFCQENFIIREAWRFLFLSLENNQLIWLPKIELVMNEVLKSVISGN
jgi:hypothetical protein